MKDVRGIEIFVGFHHKCLAGGMEKWNNIIAL